MSKPSIDWAAIQPHHHAGIRSLRDIGGEFGVSDVAIIKHARKNGWTRQRPDPEDRSVPLPITAQARRGFIYVVFIEADGRRFYKIGMATAFLDRIQAHQTASPFEVRIAIGYFTSDARSEEALLHSLFAEKHVRGEWFALDHADLQAIAARSLLLTL